MSSGPRPSAPKLDALLASGTMTSSLATYVPSMIFQKGLGLGRVLLLLHLLREARDQYGLWAIAGMVAALGAPILTAGANHGLGRYVSYYEARGELGRFYRQVRWWVLGIVVLLTVAAAGLSGPITQAAFVQQGQSLTAGQWAAMRGLCLLALANAGLLALHYNVLAICYGLRAYRLASGLEMLFGVLFTIAGPLVLWYWPTASAVLWAHLASLTATLLAGIWLVHLAIERRSSIASPTGQGDSAGRTLRRVLRFGIAAMVGGLCWQLTGYVSFYIASKKLGPADGGVFNAFWLLAQPVAFLAASAWSVLYAHTASRWESGDKLGATDALEAAYKAVSLALLALAVAIDATAPLWVRVVPPGYRQGLPLLPWLLLFFQTTAQLSLVTMLAQLRHRPTAALVALAGAALNAGLALWGVAQWGLFGAAWAAGIGLYVGGGLAALIYLITARAGLHRGTYIVLAAPALLMLPVWASGAALAGLIMASIASETIFSPPQKAAIVKAAKRLLTSSQ